MYLSKILIFFGFQTCVILHLVIYFDSFVIRIATSIGVLDRLDKVDIYIEMHNNKIQLIVNLKYMSFQQQYFNLKKTRMLHFQDMNKYYRKEVAHCPLFYTKCKVHMQV